MRSTEQKKLYEYVGPPELHAHTPKTARILLQSSEDVASWAQTQTRAEALVATFVVDSRNQLWIADRRSEHIACARGEQVQAAGELEFQISKSGVEVVGATNQSTGFCPRVESWEPLKRALDAAGLSHPPTWTTSFKFRRCEQCKELNVVKDEWFVCSTCDADLPRNWNIGNNHNDMGH